MSTTNQRRSFIRRLAIMSIVVAVAATSSLFIGYRDWKRKSLTRLAAGSQLIGTRLGPVEYATWGGGGKNDPVVLVAHGTPGGYDQGVVLAQSLGKTRFSFVAPSRPGYLRTPLSVGRSPEEQADAFAALLDALNLTRVAVMGWSGGGPSAVQFALRHADRCWAVVLVSPVIPDPQFRSAGRILPRGERIFSDVLGHNAGGWLFGIALPFLPRRWLVRHDYMTGPIGLALLWSLYPRDNRWNGTANDSMQFRSATASAFERIRLPTLVVHGNADNAVPFAQGAFAARSIPAADIFVVPGGGHFSIATHSQIVAPEIVGFLEKHAPHPAGP